MQLSQLLHVASFSHATSCEQHDCATHMSHFLLLVVAHPMLTPHVPPLHVFEQHSLAPLHCEPSGLHGGGGGGGGGAPQIPFAEQY